MKLNRQLIYLFLVLSIFSGLFVANCSSDDPSTVAVAPDDGATTPDDPDDPAPITVTAPDSLNGIWKGTMTGTKIFTDTFDVEMVFYMPDGEVEGTLLAVISEQGTGNPFRLLEAGYDKEPNVNFGFEYLAGTQSSQGTFVKYFEFDNKLVGSNKGGSIGFNKTENILTGIVELDDGSRFDITLEYSLENASDTAMADLEGTWSDAANGWDDSSTGVDFTVDSTGLVSAVATAVMPTTCAATGQAVDISDYNIFNFDYDQSALPVVTGVTLSNCGTRLVQTSTGPTAASVNGEYSGMAIIVDDGTGNLVMKLILSSQQLLPAVATYNEFVKN